MSTDLSSSSDGGGDYDENPQTTTKHMSLPTYSNRVMDVLRKGEALVEFDQFIEETAYQD